MPLTDLIKAWSSADLMAKAAEEALVHAMQQQGTPPAELSERARDLRAASDALFTKIREEDAALRQAEARKPQHR
jgi:hypothetical protein